MGNTTAAISQMFWRIWLYIKHAGLYLFLLIITLLWSLVPKKQRQGSYEADVYLLVSHKHCIRSIYTIASVQFFFPGITLWVINDGTLSRIDIWLLRVFRFPLHILGDEELLALRRKAKKYTQLVTLASFGWSGKKILYPLLHTRRKKIILLDTDVLFFRRPAEVITWMQPTCRHSLYLKDYSNFSIASNIELSEILPGKKILSRVNTGLLCLDMDSLFHLHALPLVNRMIPKLITIVKDRMTYDFGPHVSDFIYTPPLIEQTLYTMLLSGIDARALPSKTYMVFPAHKFWGTPIRTPIFLHFTGEIGLVNLPMYQYIFSSFISTLRSLFQKHSHSDYPWFLRSCAYCSIRSHHHVWHDARDHITP